MKYGLCFFDCFQCLARGVHLRSCDFAVLIVAGVEIDLAQRALSILVVGRGGAMQNIGGGVVLLAHEAFLLLKVQEIAVQLAHLAAVGEAGNAFSVFLLAAGRNRGS